MEYSKCYKSRILKINMSLTSKMFFPKWYFYITKNSENQILKEIKQNFPKIQNSTPINNHA